MAINIWEAFEALSSEEMSMIDAESIVGALRVAPSEFGESKNKEGTIQSLDFAHPRLLEMIEEYNNKVGTLEITYSLVRHYYDKGIPDDPWFESPGQNGESVRYMPLFQEEHWGRRYWFSYYADNYYLRISSLWDTMLELLNHYYQYNIVVDLRFRSALLKRLKKDHSVVAQIFEDIQKDPLYIEAQRIRTAAAHGVSSNNVTNTVRFEPNADVDVVVFENGKPKLDDNGKVVVEKKRGTSVSYSVGEYTTTNEIMTNLNQYTAFSARKIHLILQQVLQKA